MKANLPLKSCDTCWSLGGLHTEEAEAFRKQHVDLRRRTAQHIVLASGDRQAIVTFLVMGTPIKDREALLNNPSSKLLMDAREGWVKAAPSWTDAFNFVKSIGSRIITGVVDMPTREKRLLSCFGKRNGNQVQPSCTQLKVSEKSGHYYCGACGCGDSKLALFTVEGEKYDKLDYPYLVCPLGREGFSNERVPEEALPPGTDTVPDVGSGEDGA